MYAMPNSDTSRYLASRAELSSALGEVEKCHDGIFQRAQEDEWRRKRASGLTANCPQGYLYQITDLAKYCGENDFCRLAVSGILSGFQTVWPRAIIRRVAGPVRNCARGAAILRLERQAESKPIT